MLRSAVAPAFSGGACSLGMAAIVTRLLMLLRSFAGAFLRKDLALKLDAMTVVHDAIEDGVGERGVGEILVPCFTASWLVMIVAFR